MFRASTVYTRLRLVTALVADLVVDRVQPNERIDAVQWPALPGFHLIDELVRDR